MTISDERRVRGLEELWELREVLHQSGPGVGLPLPLLSGLQRLLRCDNLTFVALDSTRRVDRFGQWVEDGEWGEDHGPHDPAAALEHPFWRHYWSSPACRYPDQTGDVTSVTMISDFLSDREWRASPMYRDYLGPLGGDHELMLVLPDGGPGRTLRLLAWRSGPVDFTEEDRFLLQLLRPHVAAAYRRAELARARNAAGLPTAQPAALTPRQKQVLALVREGATNATVARRLGISEGTVRKHLEHIHAALGVSSRTAAAIAAEDLL